MSQKKLFITKSFKNKTILDSLLWFIENYLPQKKKRSSHSELRLNKFESIKIKKIKNLFSALSKSLKGDLRNSKVTLIVGNWASPYLNLLKKIKLLK